MPYTMQDVLTTDPLRYKEFNIQCRGVGGIATLTQALTCLGQVVVNGLSGHGGTIVSVRAVSNVAPTLTAGILDVNNDGTTIFTSTKLVCPLSAVKFTESLESDLTAAGKKVFNGDRLSVDCDELGSAAPATSLSLCAVSVIVRCDEPND